MLDIKFIRENPKLVEKAAKNKGVSVNIPRLLELDKRRRDFLAKIEELRARQRKTQDKTSGGLIKQEIKSLQPDLKKIEDEFGTLLYEIPNLPASDIKIGKDETENEVIKKVSKPKKFTYKPKDYSRLGQDLDLIDTSRASKVSGSRFSYLKNEVVLLEFALINYALGSLIKEGFTPIVPPVMIKEEMARGTGYFEAANKEDAYFTEKDKMFLVGTSEQSIVPYFANEILFEEDLPKRFVGFSSCFRREAGTYGKDTKGIFRVHQFDKVEMVSFCRPQDSEKEHKYLLYLEEKLTRGLGLPYQVVKMCTGDLGLPAASKYDLECWFPAEGRYRETHSTSNCTDFQARRLNIRFKDKKTGRLEFVHTINGTAIAIGRTILTILENYQKKDGTIAIPKILQKYCSFKEIKRR